MSSVIRFFKEFRSIFTGEDVLKENEEHANIVVSTIMFNIFIIAVVIYMLTVVGLFKVNKDLIIIICKCLVKNPNLKLGAFD